MIEYFRNLADEDRMPRLGGVVATVVYFAVILLSMWLVRCDSQSEDEDNAASGSLVIALGNAAQSSGAAQRAVVKAATPAQPTPKVEEKSQLTDERSEVEVPQPKSTAESKPTEAKPQKSATEEVVAKPREVNKKALFPGTTAKSNDSEGASESATPAGKEGTDRGTPDATSHLGEGLTGDYTLAGRSLVGALPIPGYTAQVEGRVVITITVDDQGRVTSASLKPQSSTTNDSRLISAARAAALKARFSHSGDFVQSGTITYIFKMH